jgi:tetratricopeptide (TPR) repeat protein
LKQYDEALECYEDAISEADENPVLTPFIMSKQARIYNEKKDHAKELEIYETIKKEYPKYTIIEVDKYIERAKALGAKK